MFLLFVRVNTNKLFKPYVYLNKQYFISFPYKVKYFRNASTTLVTSLPKQTEEWMLY